MAEWTPHTLRESALREIEACLTRTPEMVQLHFERARLLTALGRLQEAKQVYIDILTQNLDQFAPFNNLGAVLNELGNHKAALKVYREVVARFPDNPIGHLNLAHTLYKAGDLKEARVHYETVLRLVPDHAGAHRGLACLLAESPDQDAAARHREKGFANQPWTASRYRGKEEPVRLLILISPQGANSPIQRFLDNTTFLTWEIIPDYYTPSVPLPSHQLVINAIGDADRSAASLSASAMVLEQTTAPVLNSPASIRTTGRAENARRLGLLEGVVMPRIATFSRETLAQDGASGTLVEQGFTFPILLRTPGFHGGEHFLRVEGPENLASTVELLPGRELTAMQFLNAREGDGKIRKYRVMMIDGQLYPLHKAVSSEWKIHYFSAEMAECPEHRAEDAAFLADMPAVLGSRAMRALERIRDALSLDYAGVDFSLGAEGEILLFEANATMAVPEPGQGEKWDYRREPVKRIRAAVREMILARAGVKGEARPKGLEKRVAGEVIRSNS